MLYFQSLAFDLFQQKDEKSNEWEYAKNENVFAYLY